MGDQSRSLTLMSATWLRSALLALVAVLASGMMAARADEPRLVPISSCPGANALGVIGAHPDGGPELMRQYLFLPYAAAPVGENRWRPPRPRCWNGTLATGIDDGEIPCPQPGWPGTEDCLRLSIYTGTAQDISRQPVMVWIHGGGHLGGGFGRGPNPLLLVNQGIVVVAINYRLGALGYLAHPALDDATKLQTGNYWFLDQIAALKWVKANIAAFGGDPNNVTVFGLSAGGLSILTHLVSPLSRGLFHKAIVISGAYYKDPKPLAQAEADGVSFANRVGCRGTSASAARCLRRLSVAKILANQHLVNGTDASRVRLDNVVLKDTFPRLFSQGKFARLPVMQGQGRDELRYHFVGDSRFGRGDTCHFVSDVTPANYQTKLQSVFGIATSSVLARYPKPRTALAAATTLTAAHSDATMICTARMVDGWLARRTATYAYEFADRTAPNFSTGPVRLQGGGNFPLGAYHGADRAYVFFRPVARPCEEEVAGLSPRQQAVSAALVSYFAEFARKGAPNPTDESLPAWPRYATGTGSVMSFGTHGPALISDKAFDSDHRCTRLWDPYISK